MYVGYQQIIINPSLFGTSKLKTFPKKVVLWLDLLLLMT